MIVSSPCILDNVWSFWKLTLGDLKVPVLDSTLGFNVVKVKIIFP